MSNLFEIIDEDEFNKTQVPVPLNSVSLSGDVRHGADALASLQELEDAGVGDDAAAETYPCNFCGHCETPNDCAWAHECPKCGAPAGKISETTYCKTPTGGITGLHMERW